MSSNSDIAREVALLLATNESAQEKGWRWRKGVVLFPEARCPYCKGVIKSRAVWLVEGFYLRGQAVPRQGRPLVLEDALHPHCLPGDAICMGDAVDPLQALFNGLNPSSAYSMDDLSFPDWLRGELWGHDCAEMDRDGEFCCEFYCEGCEDYFDVDLSYSYSYADRSYCESCFYERAFYCHHCGEAYSIDSSHEGANNRNYCYNCWSEHYFTCDGCAKTCLQDDYMKDGECSDCYEYPNTCALESCGDGYDEDDTGTCTECADCDLKFCTATCKEAHECENAPEPEPVVPPRRRRRS
jgi:hypothetical protein